MKFALPNQTEQTVAHCLFEDYILIHGVPESLHSDQGCQSESEVVLSLCHLLNIKKMQTTPYHTASNSMVERFNRTLTYQMAKILLSCGGEWNYYIKQVAFANNSTPHSSTKYSPYFLVHGREPRMPTTYAIYAQFYGNELCRIVVHQYTRVHFVQMRQIETLKEQICPNQ